MALGEVLVLGMVLSADSFSAALAMGHRPFQRKDAFKFALSSGTAEAGATLIGFLAGAKILSSFSSVDHWIAFGLLALVALHMAYEGVHGLLQKNPEEIPNDFHSFAKVLLVSCATSLDALGVGVGLGVAHKPIGSCLASIGLWAFATTLIGLYLGRSLSQKMGPIFTLLGAVVLGIIAWQMLQI